MSQVSRLVNEARAKAADTRAPSEAEKETIAEELLSRTVTAFRKNLGIDEDSADSVVVRHAGKLDPHAPTVRGSESGTIDLDKQTLQGEVLRVGGLELIHGLWSLGLSIDNPTELCSGNELLIIDHFLHQTNANELLKASASTRNEEARAYAAAHNAWHLLYTDESEDPPRIRFAPVVSTTPRANGESPLAPTQEELIETLTTLAAQGPQIHFENVTERFI